MTDWQRLAESILARDDTAEDIFGQYPAEARAAIEGHARAALAGDVEAAESLARIAATWSDLVGASMHYFKSIQAPAVSVAAAAESFERAFGVSPEAARLGARRIKRQAIRLGGGVVRFKGGGK